MLPVAIVPPGPPPDFRADVLTMNNITLTWGPSLVTNLVYEICHGTKPVCSGSVSVCVCVCVCSVFVSIGVATRGARGAGTTLAIF